MSAAHTGMKAVILAGGLGTRLSEETVLKPKPMVELGGKPILWHIMKIYSAHGINDFVICLGYKGYLIKEYFANYFLHTADITFDMEKNSMQVHHSHSEPWRVTLVETGEKTLTGGRLRAVRDYVAGGTFCMTYGDGVSDVNVTEVIAAHKKHQRLATLTAVQPPGRWGRLELAEDAVRGFEEKPAGDGSWVNGGFFVLEPGVIEYIRGEQIAWEREPLEKLASEGQLHAHRHPGFWYAMDTARDKAHLEELWASGQPPWKVW